MDKSIWRYLVEHREYHHYVEQLHSLSLYCQISHRHYSYKCQFYQNQIFVWLVFTYYKEEYLVSKFVNLEFVMFEYDQILQDPKLNCNHSMSKSTSYNLFQLTNVLFTRTIQPLMTITSFLPSYSIQLVFLFQIQFIYKINNLL